MRAQTTQEEVIEISGFNVLYSGECESGLLALSWGMRLVDFVNHANAQVLEWFGTFEDENAKEYGAPFTCADVKERRVGFTPATADDSNEWTIVPDADGAVIYYIDLGL